MIFKYKDLSMDSPAPTREKIKPGVGSTHLQPWHWVGAGTRRISGAGWLSFKSILSKRLSQKTRWRIAEEASFDAHGFYMHVHTHVHVYTNTLMYVHAYIR